MTEPDQTSLGVLLGTAARAIPVPDPDAFASAVARRLRAQPSDDVQPRAALGRRRRRPLLTVPLALLAVAAVVATLAPTVRSTLADLLGGGDAPTTRAARLPLPAPTTRLPRPTTTPTAGSSATTRPDPGATLRLGTPSTLLQAAHLLGFPMRLPTVGGYQQPDAVFVGAPPAAGTVSMVYLPKVGQPEVPGDGVAALLTEFRGHLDPGPIERLAGNGIGVQAVQLGRAQGFWLSGAPPIFPYVKPDGTIGTQTIRLATNTLLWSFGGVTYLFESTRSREAAIAIALSMP